MWSSFIVVYSRLHGFSHPAEITTRSDLLPGPPEMKHVPRTLIALVSLSISLAISSPSWGKNITHLSVLGGFPGGSGVQSLLAVQEMEMRVQPQGREAALEEERAPAPASLPGKPHGQAGYVRGVAQSRTPEEAPQQPRGVNSSQRSTLQAGGRGTAV